MREITVRKVDQFIKRLATTKSYSMAKQARTVLSLAFGLAVRYDAIAEEPGARHCAAPQAAVAGDGADPGAGRRHPSRRPSWRRAPGTPGPPPDGQLEQIIEVMLGTSARIGEVLAIRKCDVDVTVSPATVRICGTIVSPAGQADATGSRIRRRRSRPGWSRSRASRLRCSASDLSSSVRGCQSICCSSPATARR